MPSRRPDGRPRGRGATAVHAVEASGSSGEQVERSMQLRQPAHRILLRRRRLCRCAKPPRLERQHAHELAGALGANVALNGDVDALQQRG